MRWRGVQLATTLFAAMVATLPLPAKARDHGVVLLITLTWPDGYPDDVDLVVRDPSGRHVMWWQKDIGQMYIARDDQGDHNEELVVDGEPVALNMEAVIVREAEAGEYTVNAYHYTGLSDSVPVALTVARIFPDYEVIFYGVDSVAGRADEVTMVRFNMDHHGNAAIVSRDFEPIYEDAQRLDLCQRNVSPRRRVVQMASQCRRSRSAVTGSNWRRPPPLALGLPAVESGGLSADDTACLLSSSPL